jgi:FkbM family methyltransferase
MNIKTKKLLRVITSIIEFSEYIQNHIEVENGVCDNLRKVMILLGMPSENRIITLLETLKSDRSKLKEFLVLLDKWLDSNLISMANRITTSETYRSGHLGCDRKFGTLVSTIRQKDRVALIADAMECLKRIKAGKPKLYELLTVGYRGWYFENNWLDGVDGGNNSLIINRITTLKENTEQIEWLYDHLEDNASRISLNAMIENWLTFSMEEALNVAIYRKNSVVANSDIFPFYDGEVFVDCGSYIGDTIAEFIDEVNRNYQRVYTYEISAPTVDIMRKNLTGLDNIVYNTKGVSDRSGELDLVGVDGPFHGNRLEKRKKKGSIPVVKLDDDVQEPITFLKVDVEGLDKEAISGATKHIRKSHPRMHIDTYHKLGDFFEVPLLIHDIDETYKYYMRIVNSLEKQIMFPITCVYAL